MEQLKYVIIDDDLLAHSVILNLMQIHSAYECSGKFYNVKDSIEPIRKIKPDFIFLDIDMPDFKGFELIKYIDKSIKVIITTSHRKYALDGFQHGVIDFLTKPIPKERLFEAINKVSDQIKLERKSQENQLINLNRHKQKKLEHIYVSRLRSKEQLQVAVKDILYITKHKNEVEINTDNDGFFFKAGSLKEIIKLLSPDDFSFANQSFIFNISKKASESGEIISYYDNHEFIERIIKVSPNYIKNFKL